VDTKIATKGQQEFTLPPISKTWIAEHRVIGEDLVTKFQRLLSGDKAIRQDPVIAEYLRRKENPATYLGKDPNDPFYSDQFRGIVFGKEIPPEDYEFIEKTLAEKGVFLGLLFDNQARIIRVEAEFSISLPVFNAHGKRVHNLTIPFSAISKPDFLMFFPEWLRLVVQDTIWPVVITGNPFLSMSIIAAGMPSCAIAGRVATTNAVHPLPIKWVGRKVYITGAGYSATQVVALVLQLLSCGAEVRLMPAPKDMPLGAWLLKSPHPQKALQMLESQNMDFAEVITPQEAEALAPVFKHFVQNPVMREKLCRSLAKAWKVSPKSVQRTIFSVKENAEIQRKILAVMKRNPDGITMRTLRKHLEHKTLRDLNETVEALARQGVVEKNFRQGIRGPGTYYYRFLQEESPLLGARKNHR
jgi:hypothetical protein